MLELKKVELLLSSSWLFYIFELMMAHQTNSYSFRFRLKQTLTVFDFNSNKLLQLLISTKINSYSFQFRLCNFESPGDSSAGPSCKPGWWWTSCRRWWHHHREVGPSCSVRSRRAKNWKSKKQNNSSILRFDFSKGRFF